MEHTQITREVLNKVERLNEHVYVLLGGANLGNPREQLEQAIETIEKDWGVVAIKSAFYQSKAWGFESENDFLNQVWIFEKEIHPLEAMKKFQNLEKQIGRKPKKGEQYESRLIDIDILFYGNLVFNCAELTVPHRFMTDRKFTMEPLAELLPSFIHPIFNKALSEINEHLAGEVIRL